MVYLKWKWYTGKWQEITKRGKSLYNTLFLYKSYLFNAGPKKIIKQSPFIQKIFKKNPAHGIVGLSGVSRVGVIRAGAK